MVQNTQPSQPITSTLNIAMTNDDFTPPNIPVLRNMLSCIGPMC